MFTGLFDLKKLGEYLYLAAAASGEGEVRRGRPPAGLIRRGLSGGAYPAGLIRREVGFEDLPEAARRRVL